MNAKNVEGKLFCRERACKEDGKPSPSFHDSRMLEAFARRTAAFDEHAIA